MAYGGLPFWALVVLYQMLVIFTKYEMIDVWDTVSALIHLRRMFLSIDYPCEKTQTGQVAMDLFYYPIYISY